MNQTGNVRTILLIEDNADDVFLMRRIFRKAAITIPLSVVTDGKQAMSYLEGTGIYVNRRIYPLPDLIFLDLKLPFLHGFVVLAWIRKQPDLKAIRVVILTSSMEDQDREKAQALNSPYFVKPPTLEMILGMISPISLCLGDSVEKPA